MRHFLAVLGVLATGVLLAVSATMNWRFGFSLGRTELDGQIYGAASAAADCMKALVPFFFFAALRARAWSQAAACVVVGTVVTAYSLTSALGHAALNRMDTAGQRTAASDGYKDNRADLVRAKEQLSWIPQHRPVATVQGEIEAAKTQRLWTATASCTDATSTQGRKFCQEYHGLAAELGSAEQALALEARIAELETKRGDAAVLSEADPQAAVLASLAGLVVPGVKVEDVQTALTVFVALLLEIGSAFGFYISLGHYMQASVGVRKPSRLEALDLRSASLLDDKPGVREIEAPDPDLVIANDQDADEADGDAAVQDSEHVPLETVSEQDQHLINCRAVKRYLDENTMPASTPREGTPGDVLYRDFVAKERNAGRGTEITPRLFQNLCSMEFGIPKRRLRLANHQRKTFYAVLPVREVPVCAAA